MAKKQTIGSREPGRKTTKITFSTTGDMVRRLQELSEAEGATASRVIDRLVRTGLSVEDADASHDRISKRLERAIERVEALPFGQMGMPYDIFAEQVLLSATMAGTGSSKQLLGATDESIFFVPLHAHAWRRLRSNDVTPGDQCDEALYPFLIQHGDVVAKSCDLSSYLKSLLDAGQYLGGVADRAFYMIMDAYLRRAMQAETLDTSSDVVSFHVVEGYRRLEAGAEAKGLEFFPSPYRSEPERLKDFLEALGWGPPSKD